MKSCYSVAYLGEDYRNHVVRVWANDEKGAVERAHRRRSIEEIYDVRKCLRPFVWVLLVVVAITALVGFFCLGA